MDSFTAELHVTWRATLITLPQVIEGDKALQPLYEALTALVPKPGTGHLEKGKL